MSEQAKKTPLPLSIRRAGRSSDGGWDYAVIDSEGQIIAETFQVVNRYVSRPAEANARLFAGAPELSDAVRLTLLFHSAREWTTDKRFEWSQLVFRICEGCGIHTPNVKDGFVEATTKVLCDMQRAAIAKANQSQA